MITINDLTVKYQQKTTLNLPGRMQINAGECIGIIGANGAGKSTFINTLLGRTKYIGQVKTSLHGHDIAVHFQTNAYVNTMSVGAIIEAMLQTSLKHDTKLQALIAYFAFENKLKKKYGQLSGGQQQIMTLLMVLYQDAPLTCLDEITTGLDFQVRELLIEKIYGWFKQTPKTLLLVSHYFEELDRLADKIMLLDQGQLLAFDTVTNLFKQYIGYSALFIDQALADGVNTTGVIELEGKLLLPCQDEAVEKVRMAELMAAKIPFTRSFNSVQAVYMAIMEVK
jgi:ABC-2 type transport system ATP-binding protein